MLLPCHADVLDPNGGSAADAVVTFCDQHTAGGGWTLAGAASGDVSFPAWDLAIGGTAATPSPFDDAVASRYVLGQQLQPLEAQAVLVSARNSTTGEVVNVVGWLPTGAALGAADTSSASLASLEVVATASSPALVCSAQRALAVWCQARACGDNDSIIARACAADVQAVAVAGIAQGMECEPLAWQGAAPGCNAAVPFDQVAVFVREAPASAAQSSPAAAPSPSALSISLGLADSADNTASELCDGVALGASKATAAYSCNHILADAHACSGGTSSPPSGMYWISAPRRSNFAPVPMYCSMDGAHAGGGWTQVGAHGASATSGGGIAITGDLALVAVDTAGIAFNEVLVLRDGNSWCGGSFDPVNVTIAVHDDGSSTFDGTAVSGAGQALLSAQELGPAGSTILWTSQRPTAAWTLQVGSASQCPGAETSARVFVRDSTVQASAAASQAAAMGVQASPANLVLAAAAQTVNVATPYAAARVACEHLSVDAALTMQHHPGFLSDGDVMAPVPQLEYVTPGCSGEVEGEEASTAAASVEVPVLASSTRSVSSPKLFAAARDCGDLRALGVSQSGWYDVYPLGAASGAPSTRVYCDQTSAGGGWTVVYVADDDTSNGNGVPAYLPGLAPLVAASTEVLLGFRGDDMADATYAGDGAAAWTVVETPDEWRSQHPASHAGTDVDVPATVYGDSAPAVRRLRFGSGPASAVGGCAGAWTPGTAPGADATVFGRVCVDDPSAPYWAGFAAVGGEVCGRSSGDATACSSRRRFSLAVRGGQQESVSAAVAATSRVPAHAHRLRVQSTSDRVVNRVSTDATGFGTELPTSCADALQHAPSATSGYYTVAPMAADGSRGAARRVFCDMDSAGGWQLCAEAPAAGFDYSQGVPMVSDWAHGTPSWAWSHDCSSLLQPGAMVSISSSGRSADAASAAVLQAPLADAGTTATGTPLAWQASGSSPRGAIAAFTVAGAGLGNGCDGQDFGHGPLLTLQAQSRGNVCAAAGALAGIHACAGCVSSTGALGGAPHRGRLAFWVRPTHDSVHQRSPVPPSRPRNCQDVFESSSVAVSGPAAVWPSGDDAPPVLVQCDFSGASWGEVWTVAAVSSPGGRFAYAPGVAAVVATSDEVRLGVSALAGVTNVTVSTTWAATATPDLWRRGHPAAFGAVDLPAVHVRTGLGDSGTGIVRFGRGSFDGAAATTTDELCAVPWDAVPAAHAWNASHDLLPGRVCVGSGNSTVAWSWTGSSKEAAPVGDHACTSTDGGIGSCDGTDWVVSIAVRHYRARSRTPLATSCAALQDAVLASYAGSVVAPPAADLRSGWYTVYPSGDAREPAHVHCDFDTDGGGWTQVFAAPPGATYAATNTLSDLTAPSSGSLPHTYLAGTLALVSDPRNEVLLAFRNRTGHETSGGAWVRFDMPAEWRTRPPTMADAATMTTAAVVEEAGGTTAVDDALVRFGRGEFVGSGCTADWDQIGVKGAQPAFNARLCVGNAQTLVWSGFLDGTGPAVCGTSTSSSPDNPTESCEALGLWLTIAVRPRASSNAAVPAHAAIATCADVHAAGATRSGVYPIYPHRNAEPAPVTSLSALPRTCAHVLMSWPTAPNGLYTLLPAGAPAPVEVWCDMAGGGWMHCGTHVSGRNTSVALGMVSTASRGGATDLARRSSGYSVDCRFALVPGAQVAFSDSVWSPGAGVSAAVLTTQPLQFNGSQVLDGVPYTSATRWGATGAVADGAGNSAGVAVEYFAGNLADSVACGVQGQVAVGLRTVGGAGVCSGAGSSIHAGVQACPCDQLDAVLDGAAVSHGRTTALWVKPPVPADRQQPVNAFCDLDSRSGGWTVVFDSHSQGLPLGDSARGDGTNDPAGLRSRAYAAGYSTVVSSANAVLVALRDADGRSVDAATVAELTMPSDWRMGHPASYAGRDLDSWPVFEGNSVTASARRVRYGCVHTGLGATQNGCSSDWLEPGREAQASSGGLLCVEGTTSAMWYGWSSSMVADVCDAGNAPVATASWCTPASSFTLAVKQARQFR